jgi:uncharacterized protein YndB with AHSA1/START domain
MSKWMTGCLVILVCLAIAVWFGYRKMMSVAAGPSPSVVIQAPAERVFASLANGDSLATWMSRGNVVSVRRHGMLVPGDTVAIGTRQVFGGRSARARWIVSEVNPSKVLALQLRDDSTGILFATRRDSLVALGDSTRLVSDIIVSNLDSLKASRGDTNQTSRSMLQMTAKFITSAVRLESEFELKALKAHIEGKTVPAKTR